VPLNAIDVPDGVGSQVAGAVLANTLTTQGFSSDDGRLTGFAVANATISFDRAKFEQELAEWKLNDPASISTSPRSPRSWAIAVSTARLALDADPEAVRHSFEARQHGRHGSPTG